MGVDHRQMSWTRHAEALVYYCTKEANIYSCAAATTASYVITAPTIAGKPVVTPILMSPAVYYVGGRYIICCIVPFLAAAFLGRSFSKNNNSRYYNCVLVTTLLPPPPSK